MRKWMMSLLLTLLALPASAEQQKTIKDIEVHYSAFNSTVFNPKGGEQLSADAQRLYRNSQYQRVRSRVTR